MRAPFRACNVTVSHQGATGEGETFSEALTSLFQILWDWQIEPNLSEGFTIDVEKSGHGARIGVSPDGTVIKRDTVEDSSIQPMPDVQHAGLVAAYAAFYGFMGSTRGQVDAVCSDVMRRARGEAS